MMELILFIITAPFTIAMFVMKYGLSLAFWFFLGSYLWSFVSELDLGKLIAMKESKFKREKPEDYIL